MMMKEEEIKEHLMSANPEFRRLVEEHKHYEGQLAELLSRHHMTEQDHLEEVTVEEEKAPAQRPDELHDSEVSERTESSAHVEHFGRRIADVGCADQIAISAIRNPMSPSSFL